MVIPQGLECASSQQAYVSMGWSNYAENAHFEILHRNRRQYYLISTIK
jgi:hypothetical protein